MKRVPVIAKRSSGKTVNYQSIRAAARALSGTGKDTTSFNRVRAAVANGGGYVGKVWVSAKK